MKPLPLDKAVELYKRISPYFKKDVKLPAMVGEIARTNPEDYTKSIALMLGIEESELLKKYEPKEVVLLFVQGLNVNKFPSLVGFIDSFGVSNG